MGVSNRYYYLKPKSLTKDRVSSRKSTRATPARGIAFSNGGQVMNMDFETADSPRTGMSVWWLMRSLLVVMLAGVLYIGGGLIYQAADSVKAGLTDLADKGVTKLEAAAAALANQDVNGARTNFIAAENLFTRAQQDLLSLGQTNLYLSGLGDSNSRIVTGQKLVDSGLNLAKGGEMLIDTLSPLLQYFNGASATSAQIQDSIVQVAQLLSDSTPDLDRALARVNKATQILASIDPNLVDATYAAAITNAQAKTETLQQLVGTLGTISRELPAALGFNTPRQYLFLNQNNNELRATGGFIGSYILVDIYRGEIQDVKVDITQRVDGQNPNSKVELPAPLRTVTTYFGTRDSNWYFDYPRSATTFQKLYEEAGGGTADGIIAINPSLAQDMLNIFGPIYIESKDVYLTAANFVEMTQRHVEILDNDLENPKEILRDFAPILMDRLMNASSTEMEQVSTQIMSRLQTKDIMVYMRNHKLQDVLEQLGFAGRLPGAADDDFLAVVQSNLGGNKSSQNVIQEVEHIANINLAGDVQNTLNLTYTHTGTDEFPDGTNHSYIRVYTPLGSKFIAIQGQDYGTTVEEYEEDNRQVFAFWMTVKPGEITNVALQYQLAEPIYEHYDLVVAKQSGANNTLFSSTVKLSPALQVAGSSDQKIKKLFSGKLTQDLELGVDFIQVS